MPVLFALLLCFPSAQCVPVKAAQDPGIDPFYQPPVGFETLSPGTILRERKVDAALFGLVPDPVFAHQLLYRTTAVNGSAIATVTTIFRPSNAMTDRFLSFHTAYDSASVSCDPSYQYQLGAPQTDVFSTLEMLFIQRHLINGYIVASPDYEGPDAALIAGRLEGMAVLDGMRAVVNFRNTLNLSTAEPAIVGAGYSGGGLATGWAASLQSLYAPELNVKGWAMGGVPNNLTAAFLYLDNTTFSGFIPAAIDGMLKPSAYQKQLQPVIDSIITEKGQALLDYGNTHCVVADLFNAPHQSMFSTDIQKLGTGLLREPTIVSIMLENLLPGEREETPVAPVFIYHGLHDDVIDYTYIPALVDTWCQRGVSVQFTTYVNGGHARVLLGSVSESSAYIDTAFAGTLERGCSSNTKDARLDAHALSTI
ncbi:secretory lipase-domain-containing protein [Aspergillus stella-maris]|uniref:secretory lipase-domain-containing protein n=1 Tax=Aspergillus stella-maris TaxID=1810926 RepID=UPI003CCDCB3A